MAAPEERELTAEQTEKLLQFQVRRAGHTAAVLPPPGPIAPQPGRGRRAGPARSGCGGAGPGPSRGRSLLAAVRRPPGPGGAVPGAAGPSGLAEEPALGSVPVIRGGCSVTPCPRVGPAPRPAPAILGREAGGGPCCAPPVGPGPARGVRGSPGLPRGLRLPRNWCCPSGCGGAGWGRPPGAGRLRSLLNVGCLPWPLACRGLGAAQCLNG